MADIESSINIDINTSDALANLRSLQREISSFQQAMSKTGAVSSAQLSNMQQNLVNNINSTGQFTASIQRVATTTESFTRALEKNQFSMGQYFKYAGASTQAFGKLFRNEFDTIEKVARERVKTLQTQYIKLGRDANGAMQAISVRPQVLDMKDLGTQTAITAQKAQLFNQLMKQGSTELLNFGKNTQWAGRQLMVGFTIPLGIMGAAAAKEFQKIEEQVIRLQRVYGDFTTTVGETQAITSQIKGLADEFTRYGVAVDKTIGLAADAAAMGKTGADLVAQVSEANRLAVLGGVDQQQSLETTISLTNAFGVSADKLSSKINFLNAVENQTVTSIQDMATAIPIAAPVVEQLGGKVEDLTFFLTAMKEGGINASEGANALKSGLASIINPTAEATDMLNSFGISIQDIVQKDNGNVKQMVLDVAGALNSLDPLQRAQAIETMFGKFQFSRMSTLFKNVTEQGGQAARVLDLTKASASELASLSEKELAKISASPLYQFQGAVERFQAALAPIGETFMKAVTPIINFGTDILNKFNEMGDGAKQFWVILAGAVAGLGPILLMTFGLVANGVANVIKGFLVLKNIFTGTGKSSNLLADQMNYMTSEQLQAAAVASSLGQVHTDLIQTFNAETGAVNNLAAAYQRAVAAQGAFTGPIVGSTKGKGRKKMAGGGIVSGPGTGTSDSIPAMLSNGEAVIPAQSVKRFPGFVAALITGNVPHLASGGVFDDLADKLRGAPNAIAEAVKAEDYKYGSFDKEEKALVAEIRKRGKANGLSQIEIQKQVDSLIGMDRSHVGRSSSEYSVAGRKLNVKDWRTQDLQMDHRSINQYAANLQERGAGPGTGKGTYLTSLDRNRIAELAGVDTKNSRQMKAFNAEMDNLIAGGHPQTRMGYQALHGIAQHQMATDTGNSKQDRNRRTRAAGVAALLKTRLGDTSSGSYLAALEGKKMTPAADENANKKAKAEVERKIKNAETKMLAEKNIQVKEEKTVTKEVKKRAVEAKKQTKTESQQAKDVKTTTRDRRQAWTTTANGRYYDPERKRFLSNEEGERRKKNQERREAAAAKRNADLAKLSTMPNAQSRGTGRLGRIGNFMSSGRMAGAGLAVAGGLGLASMAGGPVGEVAGAIAGPLSMLSMALPLLGKLPIPVMVAMAAIAGLSTVVIGAKQAFDKSMQSAVAFGDQLGAGTNAMARFTEFTGNVTSSQSQDAKRSGVISAAREQLVSDPTIGQQYLSTDAGKALSASITDNLKNVDMKTVREMLYQQMATAITTGAMDTQTAKSIVLSLGEQLQNPSMAVNINAKLNELFGPNGEKLTQNAFEIAVKLSDESAADLQKNINAINKPISAINPFEYWDKYGSIVGTTISLGTQSIQQQQQLLDSLDVEYQKRLELAQQSGQDTSKLTSQYNTNRASMIKDQQQTVDNVLKPYMDEIKKAQDFAGGSSYAMFGTTFNANVGAMGQAMDQQIKATYAGDATQALLAQQAQDLIVKSDKMLNQGEEYKMKFLLSTGDIPPQTFIDLIGNFADTADAGKVRDMMFNIVSNLGTADGGQVLQMAQFFETPAQQKNFMANFDGKSTEEAKKIYDIYSKALEVGGVESFKVVAELDVKGARFKEIEDGLNAINDLFGSGNTVTYQQVVEQKIIRDEAGANAFVADSEYFNSLPAAQQKVFVETYFTVMKTVTPTELAQYLNSIGAKPEEELKGDRRESGLGGSRKGAAPVQRQYSKAQLQSAMQALANLGAVEATSSGGSTNRNGSTNNNNSSGGGGGGSSTPELTAPTQAEQYNAALNLISKQEEEINKLYDERIKALDDIQKAQEAITQQQQDQLDLSDALTRGDVSAAARAAQQMRSNNAARALETQKNAIEASRKAALSQVTYGGHTREWYQTQLDAIDAAEQAAIAAGTPRARGGYISGPGSGTSDSIPAMLSNGEYVIRAAAVKALGLDRLNALNNADRLQFASGGLVPPLNSLSSSLLDASQKKRFRADSLSTPAYNSAQGRPRIESMVGAGAGNVSSNNTSNKSVYNYNVNVSAATNADPEQVASAVMRQIRNMDSNRVRGNYVNG